MRTGWPKCARRGSSTFAQSTFIAPMCRAFGVLAMCSEFAVSENVNSANEKCGESCMGSVLFGEESICDAGRHARQRVRSEEHTSELQSLMRISYAVFCLKKKMQNSISVIADISLNANTAYKQL